MDKLQVINTALMKAGLPLAACLEDCDWNAAIIFDQVAESLLREHDWGFAQKFATLSPAAELPPHSYKYAYLLPADCVKMVSVHCMSPQGSPQAEYETIGRAIYTNASPCHVRYVCKMLDPQWWLPDFAIAVAATIAQEIIALSGQNMGLVPQLLQLAEHSLAKAQLADARESRVRYSNGDGGIVASRGNS